MPWWRESDTFFDDPIWDKLTKEGGGKRRGALYNQLKVSYCDMKSYAARHMTNGWLSAERALELCQGKQRVLDLLSSAAIHDRPPLIHKRGEECECLPGPWNGDDYLIHGFLWKNPSRAEKQRNDAQNADRADKRLQHMVFTRDAGRCRYCRSGPVSEKAGRAIDRRKFRQFDHVDPDKPAGPDGENYVTSCARCNEHKGHRTPDEADMVLLPVPTEAERAAWVERGRELFDMPRPGDTVPPPSAGITDQITVEPPSNHRSISDSTTDRITDSDRDCDPDPIDDPMGGVRLDSPDDLQEQVMRCSPKGPGSGRGASAVDGPARASPSLPPQGQPVRPASNPDIYHRRSRGPAPPELPPLLWPPGSVPAEPRRPRPPEEETSARDP